MGGAIPIHRRRNRGEGWGPGPLNLLFEVDQYDRAPTFEKCRPIFELKVTPYFQMYHQSEQ